MRNIRQGMMQLSQEIQCLHVIFHQGSHSRRRGIERTLGKRVDDNANLFGAFDWHRSIVDNISSPTQARYTYQPQ